MAVYGGMNSYNEQRRRAPSVDNATDTNMVILYEHHEIHDGSMFNVFNWSDVPANGVIDIRITTANSEKWMHFIEDISTEAEGTFWFYEGVVINTAGTALTPRNNNRNSTNTSLSSIDFIVNDSIALANADTDISGATLLMYGKSGSGRNSGGGISRDVEMILKQNTIYSVRVQNNDNTSTRWVDYHLLWYEHANKL